MPQLGLKNARVNMDVTGTRSIVVSDDFKHYFQWQIYLLHEDLELI
jgi:hypothetical protein